MSSLEISDDKTQKQSSGFSNLFKSFDYYRTVPNDLSESTYSGVLISFLCAGIMIFFVYFEVLRYFNTGLTSEMYIDVIKGTEKLQVNIDITFPNMPCPMIGIDIQDIVGAHSLDLGGQLYKRKLDKNGKILQDNLHLSDHHDHRENEIEFDLTGIKQGFLNHEGCQLYGYITVNKVPGNFHISSHSLGPLLGIVMAETGVSTFDMAHKINHLSFGKYSDIEYVRINFDRGSLNPLDGKVQKVDDPNRGYIIQYFLQIVSTNYVDTNGYAKYVCQFTAHSHNAQTDMIPAVYFKYDLSPMTVKYTKEKEVFLHFIVQICAIIGGIFTIAHMIDNILVKLTKKLFSRKDNELDK